MAQELQADVLVVGAGTGGVAAAIALCSRGKSVVMTEPTDWIGGQLTQQGVPPDENRWIEHGGADRGSTATYADFRRKVRARYAADPRVTDAARANPLLNPGNGWVSRLCFDPAIGHDVLREMIAPFEVSGRLRILLHTEPVSADVNADKVQAVVVRDASGKQTTIRAKYVIDASEFGDLLELAGVEHAIGAEHQSEYGEMHARTDKADPHDIQAVSWCFAIEHRPGEDHTINKPAKYAFWRDYVPKLDHPWPGKLLSWTIVGGDKHEAKVFSFKPWPQEPDQGELEMWRYRRIVDRSIYRPGPDAPPDVALINMVQMDYFLKPTLGVTRPERDAALAEAKELSLCFLYWMQTEAERFDGGKPGFPGLKLRGNELGTTDGLAKHVYVREARRLKALTMIHEGHVGTDQRKAEGKKPKKPSMYGDGEPFPDSVGIGHYRLDLHPSTAMRNSIYVHSAPFRIPMGALIPVRVRNLLAGAKNIGVTHVTNGCYRLHPVEWNAGEAAGHLAAYCIDNAVEPQAVHADLAKVRAVQKELTAAGFNLAWPWEESAGLA